MEEFDVYGSGFAYDGDNFHEICNFFEVIARDSVRDGNLALISIATGIAEQAHSNPPFHSIIRLLTHPGVDKRQIIRREAELLDKGTRSHIHTCRLQHLIPYWRMDGQGWNCSWS